MNLEKDFQRKLIKELQIMYPDGIIFKNDTESFQGLPDITILYKNKWALLECKKSEKESFQPNQEYYISQLNKMSFSRVIYPENKEAVLRDLQQAFGT